MERWSHKNGYKDVLHISLPLIASMGATTLMQFTDRIFLGHYSLESLAAVLPAGITVFLFISFFMGVGSYTNVFIAQYTGANRPEQVGSATWQGVYFSLFAAAILASLCFAAEFIFSLAGHSPEIQELEVAYFRISCLGSGFCILEASLAGFFSGRGITRVVMIANLLGACVNIPLDYLLINGIWIFPEIGIRGAAWATVAGWAVIALVYILLIFNQENERRFCIFSARTFSLDKFRRLLRYGLPNGVQFFLDIFAINFFIFMVGRIGSLELAATNIVFSLDVLAFLPMVGLSIGVGTLVGQAIGANKPDNARYATISALHLGLFYMGVMALIFVSLPEFLIRLFSSDTLMPAGDFTRIIEIGTILLRFVAVYTLMDAVCLVIMGTLKGAGDVHYVMRTLGLTSLIAMVLPLYVGMVVFHLGIYFAWTCLTLYVLAILCIITRRYRSGAWADMKIIES
ncbi:MAG: MATE family efflux transporter [Desulfovibrio sp.]|uniref:MATE family efflux transporter n=1 Tax=Desulfovibrio sp. 7SRBS1 TaxID=3378064 RepID=UPI003B4166CC